MVVRLMGVLTRGAISQIASMVVDVWPSGQGGLDGGIIGPTDLGGGVEPGGRAGFVLGPVALGRSADRRVAGPSGQGGLCGSASGPTTLGGTRVPVGRAGSAVAALGGGSGKS